MKFNERFARLAVAAMIVDIQRRLAKDAELFITLGNLAADTEDADSVGSWYQVQIELKDAIHRFCERNVPPHLEGSAHAANIAALRAWMQAQEAGQPAPLPELIPPAADTVINPPSKKRHPFTYREQMKRVSQQEDTGEYVTGAEDTLGLDIIAEASPLAELAAELAEPESFSRREPRAISK